MSPSRTILRRTLLSSIEDISQFDPLTAIVTQPVLYLDATGLVDGAANAYGIVDASGNVSQWSDLSSNGWHFTQGTGMNQPLLTVDGLLFNGISQYLQSTDKTKAKFLHDGTDFTIFFKWKTSDSDPENIQVLYDDCDYTASKIGHSTYYNDFSTSEDRLASFIVKATGSPIAGGFGSNGNIPSPDSINILNARFDYNGGGGNTYVLRNNGADIWSGAYSGTPSTSNATYNPTIGRRANTADSYFEGYLEKVLFYNVALSAGDIAILEAGL